MIRIPGRDDAIAKKGKAPPYSELEAAWKALRSRDVRVREVACVGAARTLLVAEIGVAALPVIALAAGIHGDEPAGPWGLLSVVESGLLDARYAYRIWPCTNPSGYRAGTRENAEGDDINRSFSRGGTTPEARAIVTANRDRRFVLSIDLHEDFEAEGFYCYEPPVAGEAPLGAAIVRAMDEAGIPVLSIHEGFDLGYAAGANSARRLERGRVLPDVAEEARHFKGLPYSVYLFGRAARRTLTMESARRLRWDDRVATHRIAIVTALAGLAEVRAA